MVYLQFYPRMSFWRRNSRELIPRVRYFRSHNLYLLFECNNKIYPKSKDQLINFRTIDSLYSLHNAVNIFRRKMHRDYNVKRPSCLDCYLSITSKELSRNPMFALKAWFWSLRSVAGLKFRAFCAVQCAWYELMVNMS